MVSIALFSIVVVVVAAAYLNLLKLDKEARATVEIANNLNFVVDTMSRQIRTGYNYGCGGTVGQDCAFGVSSPSSSFIFTDDTGDVITYSLPPGQGQIYECDQVFNTTSCTPTPITDPLITVNALDFYVSGAQSGEKGHVQPQVTIAIQGTITGTASQAPIVFDVETTATQRQINL
jgi:hypothetical protein